MKLGRRVSLFLATGGGVGYAPWAPGTLGTVVGLPFCYGLAQLALPVAAAAILIFIGLAIAIAGVAERELKQKDPGCIVIDEIAGLMVTLVGLQWNLPTLIAGFIIFRVFDIWKPFPIRQIERRLTGGVGIVMDDVVAGLLGHVSLSIIIKLFELSAGH